MKLSAHLPGFIHYQWMYYIKPIQDHRNEMEGTISQKVDDINLFRQVSDSAKMLQPVAITVDQARTQGGSLGANGPPFEMRCQLTNYKATTAN